MSHRCSLFFLSSLIQKMKNSRESLALWAESSHRHCRQSDSQTEGFDLGARCEIKFLKISGGWSGPGQVIDTVDSQTVRQRGLTRGLGAK